MNPKLLRSCIALWALGLFGMWVARAVLALDVEALPFRLAAGMWILGGLGYTGVGLVGLTASEPSAAEGARRAREHGAHADLSALIRKR